MSLDVISNMSLLGELELHSNATIPPHAKYPLELCTRENMCTIVPFEKLRHDKVKSAITSH